jgi:Holliday junction resolvase RusA-like endonuclease
VLVSPEGQIVSDVVELFVAGRPRPKGSPRAISRDRFGRPLKRAVVIHDTPAQKLWQQLVAATARGVCAMPIEGPVEIVLEFVFARAKTHWTKAGKLSSVAPPVPGHNLGDLDKLARAAIDGLNGIAFADDCQVVWMVARKRFHVFDSAAGAMEAPGVHIRIGPSLDHEREA